MIPWQPIMQTVQQMEKQKRASDEYKAGLHAVTAPTNEVLREAREQAIAAFAPEQVAAWERVAAECPHGIGWQEHALMERGHWLDPEGALSCTPSGLIPYVTVPLAPGADAEPQFDYAPSSKAQEEAEVLCGLPGGE